MILKSEPDSELSSRRKKTLLFSRGRRIQFRLRTSTGDNNFSGYLSVYYKAFRARVRTGSRGRGEPCTLAVPKTLDRRGGGKVEVSVLREAALRVRPPPAGAGTAIDIHTYKQHKLQRRIYERADRLRNRPSISATSMTLFAQQHN